MRKLKSWLGVSAGQRQNNTKTVSTTQAARQLRRAVGLALRESRRSKDEYGTVSYPTPTAAQILKAGFE